MVGTYNPWLVALSITTAVFASFTVFHLVGRIQFAYRLAPKALLFIGAIAMGGGIWSMHFIAMLAFNIPMPVDYDVLTTLISLFVAIFMTAIGLITVSYGHMTALKLLTGGTFMGLGIAAMHYIGMAAMRMQATTDYNFWLVTLSIFIAIITSTAALWLAFNLRSLWHKTGSALVMGAAIAGMHYTGMAATGFTPAPTPVADTALAMAPSSLAIAIAVAAFVYFIFALLCVLPDKPFQWMAAGQPHNGQDFIKKLPVYQNRKVTLLNLEQVIHLKADGHYTTVFMDKGRHFCNLSLSELETKLDPELFVRVHRSHIINIHYAKSFERLLDHALVIVDGDSETRIPVSRDKVHRLCSMLGI